MKITHAPYAGAAPALKDLLGAAFVQRDKVEMNRLLGTLNLLDK